MRLSRIATLLVVTFSALCTNAHALSTPLLSFSGFTVNHDTPGSSVTDGWRFSLARSVTVTDLGYFDAETVGLAQSHDVGLWTDGGTLLASATISNADPLAPDSFRYQAIAPVVLGPGTYRIGGFKLDGTDGTAVSVTGLTTLPGSAYIDGRFTAGGALAFPVIASGTLPSIFGPNLMVTFIPEPATATLGLLAFGGLMLRRRRAA